MHRCWIVGIACCFFSVSALRGGDYEPVLWNFSGVSEAHPLSAQQVEPGRNAVFVNRESAVGPYLQIRSPKRYNMFGVVKSSAGDIDGDGYDDIIIGAPLAGPDEYNPGAAYVYSGYHGLRILELKGRSENDFFGRAVAGAGDIDGDSVPDLLVSGWFHANDGNPYGRVYVLSGSTGKVLRTITSYQPDDGFGYTVTTLGDITGDGVPEIGVSAPVAQTQGPAQGLVYVFDLTEPWSKRLTTANAIGVIRNRDAGKIYFGSFVAYDDQSSSSNADVILVGSVDPVSLDGGVAQFVFSRHRLGSTFELGQLSVPAKLAGDVTNDGVTSVSDLDAVLGAVGQQGTALDLDMDGVVSGTDVLVVIDNLGSSSPIYGLLADPSPLLSRVSDLTGSDGVLNVGPVGAPVPWRGPDCDDDSDDDDDNPDDGSDDDTEPDGSVQPFYPGVRPTRTGGCLLCVNAPMLPPNENDTGDDSSCDDEDDCDEEALLDCDDDPGPDCGCHRPDGAEGESCDAFLETTNAKYVGRGIESDTFYASVTDDSWVASLRVDPDSEVGATIRSSSSQNGFDYNAVVEFEDESGVCDLYWYAVNADTGVEVRECFSVNVEDYKPVQFSYRTFIPDQAVKTPFWSDQASIAFWNLTGVLIGNPVYIPPFFGGDDRFDCNTNASVFSDDGPESRRFRSSCRVLIGCEGPILAFDPYGKWIRDCSPQSSLVPDYTEGEHQDMGLDPQFGLTRGFDGANVVGTACVPTSGESPKVKYDLIPNSVAYPTARHPYLPIDWVEAGTGAFPDACQLKPSIQYGLNGGFGVRLAPNAIRFRYFLHAADPLLPNGAAPAIDVHRFELTLYWSIDQSSGIQSVAWVLNGETDPYPAHETYLQGEPMHKFDPLLEGVDLFFGLLPTAENVEFSTTGEVKP